MISQECFLGFDLLSLSLSVSPLVKICIISCHIHNSIRNPQPYIPKEFPKKSQKILTRANRSKSFSSLFFITINWFVTSKKPDHESCFPQFFPQNFLSWPVKKESKHFIGPNWEKIYFGPILLSFSTTQTEKKLWKKLGKTNLIDWWIDVRNKISITPVSSLAYFIQYIWY